MPGFYESYLDGLKTISGIEAQQASTEMRRTETQLEIQQGRMKMQEFAREAQVRGQERGILTRAFGDRQTQAELAAAPEKLASRLQQAAMQVMPLDPKEGERLLNEANKAQTTAANSKLHSMQAEKSKSERLGALAATVTDEASLQRAIPEFTRLGEPVPAKFRQWSPETQAAFKQKAAMSVPAARQAELAIHLETEKIREKAEERRADAERRKSLTEASREERAREGLTIRKSAAASKAAARFDLKKDSDISAESAALKAMPEFADLPEKDLRYAAAEVRHEAAGIAQSLFLEDPDNAVDEAEVLRQARERVAARVKPAQGLFGSGSLGPKKGGVDKAPKKISSDAEYEALPSGTEYLAPDGQLRRKK